MKKNVFETLCGEGTPLKTQKTFDRDMKIAMRMLMERKEGRSFLRWLGHGQSPVSILQLVMEYEEEKHVA